jgi:hypothetical protein
MKLMTRCVVDVGVKRRRRRRRRLWDRVRGSSI